MKKDRLIKSPFDVLNVLLFTSLAVLTLMPFLNVLAIAISSPQAVSRGQVTLWPIGFSSKAIVGIFESERFGRSFFNSVYYMVVETSVSLVLTCLCAYPLTKAFPGKRFFYVMLVITMFFGGGLIPTYLLVQGLGLLDTVWALALPGAISTFYVFIMRTYFKSIGEELEEAARIDGATDIGVLFRIILPLSMPVLATIGLFYAVGSWNSFFGPLIYMSTREKYNLQIFLRDLLIQAQAINTFDPSLMVKFMGQQIDLLQFKYAAVIVSIVPVLCFYPVLQKYFTKGFMLGSIKA